MQLKVIITGSTGMVGEGVLLTCLNDPQVSEVLLINRRHLDRNHPKLKELLISDFTKINEHAEELKGYDGCFYCAGISSVGVSEEDFTKATYNTTVSFAEQLASINPQLVFTYVSGSGTDSSENRKVMWARVKGRTENVLMRLPFKAVYNFRPGVMKIVKGQKNTKGFLKVISGLYPLWNLLFPKFSCTLEDVGKAMIHAVTNGYPKPIIEVTDIKILAQKNS
ncbi:NAD-dependent epimerase/dehydratase family protein [Sphingobacterium hungaricum]|uniref:Epimerase n=1 Tax=Sphingobacterium hungaricum TaxID=2082723 RepID=A0A928UY32_9SPHI|nr:NAD-dependent epimerase/dehydratase family protein [Sphingobacterium hungaricum]MBE8715133.1 epimerase [Sphingobacterium hungaricum]